MTQAINLANFANSVDTSGQIPPTALNTFVPVSKGGTGGTTQASARAGIGSAAVGDAVFLSATQGAAQSAMGVVVGTNVPSTTGTGANGTWAINISGTANNATTAGNVSGTVGIANGGTGQNTAVNAGSALGAIGVGQTTQDVSASRVANADYINNTGRPIMVYVSTVNASPSSTTSLQAIVNGITILYAGLQSNRRAAVTFIVPDGSTYSIGTGDTIQTWCELR